ILCPAIANFGSRLPRPRVLRLRRLQTSRPFRQRLFDSRDSPARKSRRCASNLLTTGLLHVWLSQRIPLPKPAKTMLRFCRVDRLLISPPSFCPLRGLRPVAPNCLSESTRSFHPHSFLTTT